MSKIATGSFIVLHRRLQLPCFPAAEAGPAAIVDDSRPGWSDVGMVARALMQGSAHHASSGVRKGRKQSVVVASPWTPDPKWVRFFIDCEITWVSWHGGDLPSSKADVIIVWLPLRVMPRMKLAQAAEHLVSAAFGTGAIYTADDVDQMLDAAEVSS